MPASPAPRDDPAPAPIPAAPKKKPHPLLGKTLASCVVGDRIGRGATSSVYRARHTRLQRDVALKILAGDRSADAEARGRFVDEAKAIAKVAHENIVKVLDVVEDQTDDQRYLCILMELVDGESVQDLVDDNGALPAKKALKVALDVSRALEAAHEEEIVHRDIKPANFIVEKKTGLVKVVDFGLAAKGANNRVGTPLYMSPEAAQGKRIDEKSDIYALGVSLYQMLTGQHPFTGSTVKDILAAHVNDEAVPPSRVRPDLGTKYDKILGKLLVKAKGYRPSASDVVAMLEPLVDEPKKDAKIAVARAKAAGAKRTSAKKSPVPAVLGVVGAIAVIALLAYVLGGDDPKPPAQDPGKTAVAPPPPPPVDPAAKAKQSFADAEIWAVSNREDVEGIVRRWTAVEHETQGTEWSKRANEKRVEAEKLRDRRRRDQEQADREAQDRKNRDARRLEAYADIPKLIAAHDFETASEKVRVFGAPEGMKQKEWDRKGARLQWLGANFYKMLDGPLMESPVRASKLKPSAGVDERITGAAGRGLVTDEGGKAGLIPWETVKPADFLKEVAMKVLSQRKAETHLLFAIYAMETGLPKQSEDAIRYVNDLDQIGDVRDQIKHYFLTDEEKRALENPGKDDEE